MSSESAPADQSAAENVTLKLVSATSVQNGQKSNKLDRSKIHHPVAIIGGDTGNSTSSFLETTDKSSASSKTLFQNKDNEKSKVIGHQTGLVSIVSAVNPLYQPFSSPSVSVTSAIKPVFVVTPGAMNMKNFNLQQISFPIQALQGVQLAMPNLSQPTSILTTSEVSQSEPSTPTVSYGHPISEVSVIPVTPATPTSNTAIPTTPLPTTSTMWDPFTHGETVTVSCRKNNGLFDRRKLGSGQRGKCIHFDNRWMTPSDFELACGMSTSKDWKRSIRCGGFTFQKLISEGLVKPHSALCSCAICSDDESVTCPVRLFQPYKRRKRSSTASTSQPLPEKKPKIEEKSKLSTQAMLDPFFTNLSSSAQSTLRYALAESQLIEQRMWWRLEEISNNLLDQAQKLKAAIEETKTNSLNQRILLMQKIVSQFEKERLLQVSEANDSTQRTHSFSHELHSPQLPAIVLGPTPQKKLHLREVCKGELVKVDAGNTHQYCKTCGNQAVSECTGCHKATYCSTACQEKDWLNGHSEVCQASKTAEQTRKDKAEKALVVSCSTADADTFEVIATASVLPAQDASVVNQPAKTS